MFNMGKYQIGKEFEDELVEKIGIFSMKSWGNGFKSVVNTDLDIKAGTDFVLLGIPMDVTLNFNNKNHTREIAHYVYEFGDVHFGIRTGNGKVTFETPVLVLGFDIVTTKDYLLRLIDDINHNLEDILNLGMDEYLNAIEA